MSLCFVRKGWSELPLICWRLSFVRMISSLFFLIHSFRYTKFRLIPVFLLPVSRPILCFRQLCGNPAGLYAYDIEQSGHLSARGCAGLYRNVYLLLIRAYTLPHSLENKEIIRSVLAIFLQGTKELYKRYGKKLDEPLRREQELYRQFIQF